MNLSICIKFIPKIFNSNYLVSCGLFSVLIYLYYFNINYDNIKKYINNIIEYNALTSNINTDDSIDFNLIDEIEKIDE
jgi:hypothetical protein